MAFPRFIPSEASRDGARNADAVLAIYEDNFHRRWAEAQASRDEQVERGTAEYAAAVEFATQRLRGAQAEALAARNAIADLQVSAAEDPAKAAAAAARITSSRQSMAAIAAAVATRAAPPERYVTEDAPGDRLQAGLAGYPSWADVQPKGGDDDEDAIADRELIAEAQTAVSGLSKDAGVRRALAVSWLESHGELRSISVEELRRAAAREMVLGKDSDTLAGVLRDFGAGDMALNANVGEGDALDTDTGPMTMQIRTAVDDASRNGNNFSDEAAADAAKKSKGSGGGAPRATRSAATQALVDDPASFRTDYTPAMTAAQQRLAEAERALGAVEMPEAPQVLDRISGTRNAYADAFGARGVRVTPIAAKPAGSAPATPAPARPAAMEEKPSDPFAGLDFMTPTSADRATDADPAKSMSDADAIIRGATPSNAVGAPTGGEIRAARRPAAPPRRQVPPARATADDVIELPPQKLQGGDDRTMDRRPPAASPGVQSGGTPAGFRGARPKPAADPRIPRALLDEPADLMELPEQEIRAGSASLDDSVLDRYGLIASDGSVRTARAERLANTTPEGRRARAALDDSGGDLEAAYARLPDERTKAIAAALARRVA